MIAEINAKINNIVWGPVMLCLLIGVGLLLSVRLKFFQFRKFGFILRQTVGGLFSKKKNVAAEKTGVSSFQAVATAMAGTIGTGSIAGVATAIVAGGPGAVFWMWISALIGMITKYAEILLSLTFRERNTRGEWSGGPMYYIEKGLKQKWLAVLFAGFAVIACFGIGNATQSNSIASALESTVKIDPLLTAVVLTLLTGAVIVGGIKRIASVNEKLVPFMSMLYVIVAFVSLILNAGRLGEAFALIFRSAFSLKSAGGGLLGYGVFTAMRYGFARGVFSNEAGLGSAPIAHAASNAKEPCEQAMWGVFEVFFTTIVICTCTALVILTTGATETGLDGAALTIEAYNRALPGFGVVGVTAATVLFALSTILGWSYYGEKAMEYLMRGRLSGKRLGRAILIYRIIYTALVFLSACGGTKSLALIWQISDTCNGLMALPNLVALIGLSGVAVIKTEKYFREKKGDKN